MDFNFEELNIHQFSKNYFWVFYSIFFKFNFFTEYKY